MWQTREFLTVPRRGPVDSTVTNINKIVENIVLYLGYLLKAQMKFCTAVFLFFCFNFNETMQTQNWHMPGCLLNYYFFGEGVSILLNKNTQRLLWSINLISQCNKSVYSVYVWKILRESRILSYVGNLLIQCVCIKDCVKKSYRITVQQKRKREQIRP